LRDPAIKLMDFSVADALVIWDKSQIASHRGAV
jgi:hypothetical protein